MKFRYYNGVRYVAPNRPAPEGFARCHTCQRAWDDDTATGLTPVPAGRCPFEHMHPAPKDEPANAMHVPRYGAPLEHAIVRALVRELRAAGWIAVRVDCDGEIEDLTNRSTQANERAVLDAVFAVDVSWTVFSKHGREMGVMLVGGNGEDLISDYHCARNEADEAGTEFSEILERVSDACDVGTKGRALLTLHVPPKGRA